MRKKVVTLMGGSSQEADPLYAASAYEFGRGVARAGWTLRTGAGSGRCVMGRATDGALSVGGRVEGVILSKFWDVRHRRLHRLSSERTFAARKAGLLRGAAAVVIFPGGIGTLDELGEVLVLKQNGFVRLELVVVNIDGYFDRLLDWWRHAERCGFIRPADAALFRTTSSVRGTLAFLRSML